MFELDCQKEIIAVTQWLKRTVHQQDFEKVVIALSGGVDSAVACSLAVKALGKEQVFVLLLPYGSLHTQATEDALAVAKRLQIPEKNIRVRDITEGVDSFIERNPPTTPSSGGDIRKGNIMARVRMICLYDFAKEVNGLVCGTENKSEYHLGYFTRFGDEASDIEPIRKFYKTQVYELAKHLDIPQEIITKAPSANLWEEQTDEKEFGFTYEEADKVLFYTEQGISEREIIAKGISKNVVWDVLRWVKKNEFKHKLPYVYK